MKKVLVTGANGQLGMELRQIAKSNDHFEWYFFSRSELSITDDSAIQALFADLNPDYCINCAAYTAVDKAEQERDQAFAINAVAVSVLAEACARHNTGLVHISTDYVFDGEAESPYQTDASTNPKSVYGASKLQGEQLAIEANPQSVIIRTSWVFSSYGKSFVKTMIRLMQERDEINVVSDQKGRPTYAADLAGAILAVLESEFWKPGIYHFANTGETNWYAFATAIREAARLHCTINPIGTAAYPTPASRPHYSVLDTTRFSTTFSYQIRPWQEALSACIKELESQSSSSD